MKERESEREGNKAIELNRSANNKTIIKYGKDRVLLLAYLRQFNYVRVVVVVGIFSLSLLSSLLLFSNNQLFLPVGVAVAIKWWSWLCFDLWSVSANSPSLRKWIEKSQLFYEKKNEIRITAARPIFILFHASFVGVSVVFASLWSQPIHNSLILPRLYLFRSSIRLLNFVNDTVRNTQIQLQLY